MTVLGDVRHELAASTRASRSAAERAVEEFHSSLGLPMPTVHWARSIEAAIHIGESWRPKGEDRDDARVVKRAYQAEDDLIVALEALGMNRFVPLDSGPILPPPLVQASQVEDVDARRCVQRAIGPPDEYYRRMIGESLHDDWAGDLLDWGITSFPWGIRPVIHIGRIAELEAHARVRAGLPEGHRVHASALFHLARDVYWLFLANEGAVLADPPRDCRFDAMGRPHCEDGPALVTGDGRDVHAMRGALLPKEAVVAPDRLTVRDIDIEPNRDSRALMIERYGLERYLRDAGAVPWARDECGELFFRPQIGDSPLVAVRVRNSTPEPDGSFRHYVLRVPPHVATAREAVAWTFGMEEAEYRPEMET